MVQIAEILLGLIAGLFVPLRIVFTTSVFSSWGLALDLLFLGVGGMLALKKLKQGLRPTMIDITITLPLATLCSSYAGEPARFLLLLKLLSLGHLLRIRDYFGSMDSLHPVFARLVPLAILTPMIVHLVACGWVFLGGGSEVPGGKAEAFPTVQGVGNFLEYFRAVYWTVTTLCTVGYGDITAKTPPQMAYSCVVMVVGVGFFGFVMSNVASLLSRLDAAKEQHSAVLDRVETFMRYNRVPPALRLQVRAYYRYLWESHHGYDDSLVLETLPQKLRAEVALFLNAEIIEKVPLLKGAEKELLQDIVLELKTIVALPEEKIFRVGEIGECMYFIQKGTVDILSKEGQVLATLSDGAFFGEAALLTSSPRNATVRATSYCDLHVLKRSSFEKVLGRYPDFRRHVLESTKSRQVSDVA